MKAIFKRASILALALVLVAGAASGAVQFDSETTNSATVSDVHATSQDVQYTNGDVYFEFEVETTSPALEVHDPEANETIARFNGTDLTETYTDTSTSPETHYFAVNLSQSTLSNVELAAGENKTFEVTIINDETATNPTTTTVDMFVHADGKRTYLRLEDSEVGDNGLAQVSTETTLGFQLPLANSEVGIIDQTVPVNGSGTSATIDVKNSTLSERLSESASGYGAEEWVKSSVATVDGEPVKVYMDAAPDSASNETHIVYHSGTDSVELVTGDDYTGSEMDLVVEANRGFSDQIRTYGIMEVIGL